MSKYAICILCNDLERFEIISRNFPEHKFDLFVINDTRLGDKIANLKQIYSNATFIRGADIIDEFPKHENINRFALVLKLLIPWYMFKHYKYEKVLMLDDDVIITPKISEIFEAYENGMLAQGLAVMPGTKEDSFHYRLFKGSADIFNVPLDDKLRHVNAGHILFNRETIGKEYEALVMKWISSDIVTEALDKSKTWRSYFLDEVFMTFFTLKYNYWSLAKHVHILVVKYERVDYELLNRRMTDKALIHNALQIGKMDVFHNLIKKGILK